MSGYIKKNVGSQQHDILGISREVAKAQLYISKDPFAHPFRSPVIAVVLTLAYIWL